VWADPVLANEDGVLVNSVFFEPGARTHWHTHDGGQVLYVTHGSGFARTRDGQGGRISAGDVVHFSPGEEHWHGASPDSYLLHVAISLGGHEWLEPVSDDDYTAVPT
jgi:quercetin dioxygenase-like cupin family protein